MNPAKLRGYCGQCGLRQMSAMDLQKDPFKEEATIRIGESKSAPDPKNPDNVVRTMVYTDHVQKPAMICSGCLSDATETPTAQPIWVGGKQQ